MRVGEVSVARREIAARSAKELPASVSDGFFNLPNGRGQGDMTSVSALRVPDLDTIAVMVLLR